MAKSSPANDSTRDGDSLTYAQAGVSIEAGDAVVGLIKRHMQKTYGPRVLGRHGGFAGMFRLDYNEKLFKRNYRDPVLVSCTDGVGTKVMLAIAMNVHDTIGQDCVAMNVNDMIVQGAEPLFFLDYIGINKVVPEQIADIVKGVADGCALSDCALLGGETAEMPDVYKPGDYDLAGFAVGVVELKKVIQGERIGKGDVIIGLASSGVHSNGYSLVRAILARRKLDLDKTFHALEEDRMLGQVLLTPTRIYVKAICGLLRKYKVKQPVLGMSHITGGGLPGNVNRCLPDDVNARISLKSWTVPPIFRFLQEQGNIVDEEMFRVFNMGIGYVLVVRPHFADAVLERLRKAGEDARVIGKVTAGTGKVILS